MPTPAGGTVTSAGPLYIDLDTLKVAISIPPTDTTRDSLLLRAIGAASRSIDDHTGRRFYADTIATARTYPLARRIARSDDGELFLVDDIADLVGLAVEMGAGGFSSWTVLDASGYETDPLNAAAAGQPITALRRFNTSWSTLPYGRVRVTARWGWPAVPDVVAQAALIQASRLYARRTSPEGVTGSADWGAIRVSRIDPDVQSLLQNLVLPGFA